MFFYMQLFAPYSALSPHYIAPWLTYQELPNSFRLFVTQVTPAESQLLRAEEGPLLGVGEENGF